MMYRIRNWLVATLLLLCTPVGAATLSDIQVSNGNQQARITLSFIGDPDYAFSHQSKRTVALDIKQTGVIQGLPLLFSGNNLVKAIRSGTPKDAQTLRLVVDLTENGKTEAVKRQNGSNYTVVFTINADAPPPPPPPPVVAKRVETPAVVAPRVSEPARNPFKTESNRTTGVISSNTVTRPAARATANTGDKIIIAIDAGHGGHDPGAIGKTAKEKNINLSVALKVGNLIKNNCDDVKVIYTRSKDVFIPLARRAEIANNAKADLFISIHTNALANNRTAKGASTWTLGLAKSDANLEVAKRENSVILYESDYQTRYAGFNPNSAESYIIFEFMQDKYMEQSVHLASLMQKQFRHTCKRADRGVHQAGFLVLKASAMPSILIELGFISTPEEERYLSSEAGASTMAKGIYHAFLNYKREHEIRLTGVSKTIIPTEREENDAPAIAQKDTESVTAPQQKELLAEARTKPASATKTTTNRPIASQSTTNDSEITFKIQILTSSKPLAKNDKRLKGLKGVDYYKEKGIYKYTYGASGDYNKVLRTKRTITPQFKDAFIIAFRNGEKMNVNEAIAEFKKRKKK